MPHRRSRKFLALLLFGATVLFLEHAPVSPVQGQLSSYGNPVKLAKVMNTNVVNTIAANIKREEHEPLRITVMSGDTLSALARTYFTTVEEITNLNKLLSPDWIVAGQTLEIAPTVVRESAAKVMNNASGANDKALPESPYDTLLEAEQKASALKQVKTVQSRSRGDQYVSISREELELLARVIYAEARGEDLEGQVAVAAVVLNRLEDSRFPKTIREVIYQPRAFTAVTDKQIHLNPNDEAYRAAAEALAGKDPTEGALYYYNPRTATDTWIKSRPVVKQIGNHTFSI
ncbi:cell wall hydrolase [Paradesulfitobacterium aromaticivorans]